jgi:anhydro-N-acetylmuramic acid kinase
MLTDGAQGFDRDGAWAARGRADAALVESLLDDPYFALPAPKSTGKEYFNLGYVTKRLKGREISAEDLLASLTVTTAESVAAAIRPFHVTELIVAGGGTRNLTLMAELQARLPGVKMRRTDELGVPEAGKEALIFAIIGFLTLHGLPATVPSCTGAARSSVLGSVTPGRAPLAALLAPARTGQARSPQAPTRLVVRSPLRSA